MAFEICAVDEDNLEEMHRVASTAFGDDPRPEFIEAEKHAIEYDRMLAVADGDQLVATAGAYSFDLTVPGNETLPMAGVTWVACLPTHRRRGILRKMMKFQLDDVVRRGEAIAGLTASEAVIYGRFGYGVATQYVDAKIRKSRAGFAHDLRTSGRIRLVWDDERKKVLSAVFDAWRRTRPGSVHRSDGRWDQILSDPPAWRHGATGLRFAVHEDRNGVPDGYVQYRMKDAEDDNGGSVIVREVIATNPDVEAALWRFVLDIDLVARIDVRVAPTDTQLPWRLTDQRAFHVNGVWDFLWLRILHTPNALSTRRYATDDALVLEIEDPFRPKGAAAGRFRLEGGPDGATCTKEKAKRPDLTMAVETLGSAYLGGVKWSTLATAGRVSGSADAIRRADAMFASTPAPFCNTDF